MLFIGLITHYLIVLRDYISQISTIESLFLVNKLNFFIKGEKIRFLAIVQILRNHVVDTSYIHIRLAKEATYYGFD